MKVLFYNSYNYAPHLETTLEIAENLMEKGDEVYFLMCKGQLRSCFGNPLHKYPICLKCISKLKKGLNEIGISKDKIVILPSISNQIEIPEFENIEELKSYHYDGIDIGMAVASSLVSILREPNPDLNKNKKL